MPPASPQAAMLPQGLMAADNLRCLDCHDDVGEFYANSPHAVERGLAIPGTGIAGCEACHGPGSLHVDEGGDGFIIGPAVLSEQGPGARVAMCTQCHTNQGLEWTGGPHAGTDVSCASCHRPDYGFTDALPTAVGVGKTSRRSMPPE